MGTAIETSDDSVSLDQSSSTSASPETSLTRTTPATSDNEPNISIRRRPIPKKGHTKSRRGCNNCKRRKVKCQETLPECVNCKRLGLGCVYPESHQSSSTPSPSAALQSTPTAFTMEDLRYFHHFLVTAYPPLPMGGDAIWKDVAALSHNFDYLVHAMLGLGASHLNLYNGDCASQALSHRVKAIQSLNQALNEPCSSRAEGDARFAAIMALTFQSSCMPEGMNEFLTMIRGCHIIAETAMLSFEDSLFRSFTEQGYTDNLRRQYNMGSTKFTLEPEREILFDEFIVSLRALAPRCSSPLELKFLAVTERSAKMAKTSPVEAFAEFTTQYGMVTSASNEEFGPLTDPTNFPAQILLIHFILIEYAIGEMALVAVTQRFAFRRRACLAWVDRLLRELPEEYESYVQWPVNYSNILAGFNF
ncbi:hypothetical protein B0T25DRAFT_569992 [Lasiosphaeria hispida]|uniref:Zn(2)-C6 fungal-type domain-containing protein n=1 Tax=Lasiosphaeria hispida TaxID=260671 RepID=A0AAJ0HEF1_9PEZI|nr:hypothetical protein B0T25DRAFT_569992 [Lasiosphaeria hispida]